MATTQITGREGEQCAAMYLESAGYRILERNARFGRYEIDIVAFDPDRDMIVFVEVKARKRHSEAYPIHTAVGGHKRQSMKSAIARWVTLHDYDGAGRTDVICVAEGKIIEHLMDIGSDFY